MEVNKTPNNYKKFYWKYMWHVKGSLFLSLILSFFFGIWCFFVTWTLTSLVFHYEYTRVMKEKSEHRRHVEVIKTIRGEPLEEEVRLTKEQEAERAQLIKQAQDLAELMKISKKTNISGEA